MSKLLLATLISSLSVSAFAAPQYSANVPEEIITPDQVQSKYLGEMKYTSGAPNEDTYLKARDFVDTASAVRVFLSGIQVASMQGMFAGHESVGMKPNQTVGVSEGMLNARSIWLTPNTTTPYVTSEVDVKNGPVILELGTPVLGLLDNAAFEFSGKVGVTHPQDQGKGGKYFIYHNSYEGEIPQGYIPIKTDGYQHWLLLRIVGQKSDVETNIAKLKETMKLYPYGEKEQTEFLNLTDLQYNTVHAMNEKFYDEINALIQYEPVEIWDQEWIAMTKDLGIEKGKAFAPDERMKSILSEAAKIATAEARATYFYPEENMKVYDDRHWFTPLISGHEFLDENGVVSIDERATFHFMATGITPDMVTNTVGKGSAYLLATRDGDDQLLDGGEHYTVTLPKDVPVANFWSFMVYDNQTRSMLETDQKSAGVDGLNKALRKNEDGSVTIHFAPTAPKGWEDNWVQTMPNKGYNVIFRAYGPTETWFDKSWRPGDLQQQK
ncbi:DUF1214 domain-containing protein [Vibrio sp. D404a]|uniref:DUF1254 domain-containing protein n=1 Tax=unclassified Vibrio TaxID=2614977 RepID=UPI00255422E8|nr:MULTISPECIES: DUF1214 domain-containing protein [unclassified Vibrio]MDK9739441.1 DUF1214 domain-containing protein [Vibrio sp. D404a]MDK9798921.1 DUF1214 domain-containing protein [Vibrio sp. D449a]